MNTNNKSFIFNHHPTVTRLCHKLQFHNFLDDYKLFSKDPCNFLLPTFALNRIEDAVHLLNLEEDETHWIEKFHEEFTNTHKLLKSTKEMKELY